MVIRAHYNKQGAATGRPWTLHTARGCYPVEHIVFKVPTETEEKPNRKHNPRYFIKCRGEILFFASYAEIVAEVRK